MDVGAVGQVGHAVHVGSEPARHHRLRLGGVVAGARARRVITEAEPEDPPQLVRAALDREARALQLTAADAEAKPGEPAPELAQRHVGEPESLSELPGGEELAIDGRAGILHLLEVAPERRGAGLMQDERDPDPAFGSGRADSPAAVAAKPAPRHEPGRGMRRSVARRRRGTGPKSERGRGHAGRGQ